MDLPHRLSMPPETDLIALALAEDIGDGDVTTQYFTDPNRRIAAKIVAREACVVAGLDVAEEVFRRVDAELWIKKLLEDGAQLPAGGVAMKLRGRGASLLTAERHRPKFPPASFRRCHTRREIRCGGARHFRQNP